MPELVLEPDGSIDVESFYEPLPKQHALHISPAKYLLGIGGNYSGKSLFLIGEATMVALEYPRSFSLLLRKNFPELEKGLIQDFLNTVPPELYKYNSSKHIVTWFNGSKTFFGHCKTGSEKDLSQYLSSAFVWIGIDELGQFSFEAWNFLALRNRVNKGCQPNSQGFMPFCRMGAATNPMGPHYGWIRKAWIDKKPVSQLGQVYEREGKWYQETHGGEVCVYDPSEYHFEHSTILDNPYALERDPDAINKLLRAAPALRQKALYGDLNAVAGTYFSNFTRGRCVLDLLADRDRIRWESWQPVWFSIDWGLGHACVVYWHRRAKVRTLLPDLQGKFSWRNAVVTYREMIVNGPGNLGNEVNHRELCKMIHERSAIEMRDNPDFGDERSMMKYCFLSPERFPKEGRRVQSTHAISTEIGEELKALGLPRPTKANDQRVAGAVFMYNLIDADEYYVTTNCEELINSLETRVRDEDNLEDVLKVNEIGDDCYDSSRYGLLSMLGTKAKPQEIRDQEELEAIKDPVARRIRAYEQWLRSQKDASTGSFKPRYTSRLHRPPNP